MMQCKLDGSESPRKGWTEERTYLEAEADVAQEHVGVQPRQLQDALLRDGHERADPRQEALGQLGRLAVLQPGWVGLGMVWS